MDKTLELIKLAQNGDKSALEKLVADNVGLVWSVVRRFTNRGYEADDLFQIGSIGLIKCINKFDTNFEVKFSTYAVPMIMGEIKRFLRDDGLIKVARPIKELASKARYMKEDLQKSLGREPTLSELATALSVSMEDLIMALESNTTVDSIYSTVHQGETGEVYLIDKLEQEDGFDECTVDVLSLKEVLADLSERERQIIELRYFQDKTQSEVGKAIGVSQVQVSRIEKRVLKNLRKILI